MKKHTIELLCALGWALVGFSEAAAATIDIEGITYAVSNGFTVDSTHPEGSHFHSSNSTNLPPDNPDIPVPAAAEVGGFFGDEEVRGLSEFSLVAQSEAAKATVSFVVMDVAAIGLAPDPIGGLYGQEPYEGIVEINAYSGNGGEDLSDYETERIGDQPLMTTDATTLSAGDEILIEVTDLFNELVNDFQNNPSASNSALGIRLQMAPPANPDSGAITFESFKLTVEPVPEPSGLSLLILLTMIGGCRRQMRFTRR